MRDTLNHKRFVYTLFILFLFTASHVSAAVQKSPTDQRDYLTFTLPNEMKVLVISDPTTDKAAASVNINIGSNANPKHRLGLAHFLEHMLFLGTDKYPEAGSYQEFISNHGGNHNAFTAFENTNYFFDIKADQLAPALDRFSRFFIEPLFAEKYVDRERHAVNSEYQSKLRDDGRRGYSASKHLMNAEHSMSQFAVGSLATLSNKDGKLRQDLIDFYHRYYSANLMSVVVLGPASVNDLKALVEEKFSAIKNNHATPFISAVPLYQNLPQQQNIKTLKDLQQLRLTFPIQATREYYREKPVHFIASMLGYEGKGSLFSTLKSKGWVNSLSAYQGLDLPDQSTIELSISLTDAGLKQYNQVIETTFAAIQLLKQQGISAALYQEEQKISDISFRFKEQSEPIHEVVRLSQNLLRYPAANVISADYLMEKFAPSLINQILDQMNPDNLLITLQAKSLNTDQQDPWFNAHYSIEAISSDRLQQWRQPEMSSSLQVRQLNPYIADDFSLKPIDHAQQSPQRLMQRDGYSLWHQQDTTFKLPKADFFFSVISAQANQTPSNAVMTALYTKLINDQLNETLYDAALAGLNTRIYPHMRGFSVRISGYDDKQPQLLNTLISSLQQAQFDQHSFARIKEKYTQELENSRKDKPFNQTIGELYNLLLQSWSSNKKLAALEEVTLNKLNGFIPTLLNQIEVRILAHGNLTQAEALQMAQTVQTGLPSKAISDSDYTLPVILLPKAKALTQTLPLEHNDSAISVYFQGDSSTMQRRAEYALLAEILSAPFYSDLRTEQQLGYIVFATALPMRQAPGLAFVVQSPNTNPLGLEQQIDRFIENMAATLSTMDNQQLAAFKRSVISRINQKENRMGELSERYWQEIDRGELDFDSRERLTQAIDRLTLTGLKASYRQLTQRRLTVRSFGEQQRDGVDQHALEQLCDTEIAELKQAAQFVPEV
ncbi:insulinase family protein [Amphritea sp. 1_MG-2023]|uniref:insulinase family protein n=1 Tax=Amphritea sp. 1_MG-2023 TaxID=3062670 RepID=UPI0026E1811C|nr:insulinase family protein [Amphritea sp. 1_MG-2023]MDO6562918.1 insulinase family protein [Amphritea sp. 1_MG-2023]